MSNFFDIERVEIYISQNLNFEYYFKTYFKLINNLKERFLILQSHEKASLRRSFFFSN